MEEELKIKVIVRTLMHDSRSGFPIMISPDATIAQLKRRIASSSDPSIPTNAQSLFFSAKLLEDEKRLSDYGIGDRDSIYMTLKMKTGLVTAEATSPRLTISIPKMNVQEFNRTLLLSMTQAEKHAVLDKQKKKITPRKIHSDSDLQQKKKEYQARLEQDLIMGSKMRDLKKRMRESRSRRAGGVEHAVSESKMAVENELEETESEEELTEETQDESDFQVPPETEAELDRFQSPAESLEELFDLRRTRVLIRCHQCHQRLPLVSRYTCHCNRSFCAKHRIPESHSCPYNFGSSKKKN